MPGSPTKFYCFTINNPTSDDDKQLADLAPTVGYLVYGRETGESDTFHYQGYVELTKPQRLSWLKKRLARAHLEPRKGTRAQARNYCLKDGDFREFGTFTPDRSGQRTDLTTVRDLIRLGYPMDQLEFDYFHLFVRYHRYFHDFAARLRGKPRDFYPKVVIHWGPSGKGKTRAAFEASESSGIVHYTNNFFQGYKNQDVVIFDEVNDPLQYFGRSLFLQLCDRYPMTVNVKGGEREWNPKEIHFTSNYDPTYWVFSDPAVKRRVHEIKKY